MSRDIETMSSFEIESYLSRRKSDEWQKKMRLERSAAKQFLEATKIEIYESSDYCGMKNGFLEFYYGYEVTENDEWCFVAKYGGMEELRIPRSKLWYIEDASIMWYLLGGIGQYLQKIETER